MIVLILLLIMIFTLISDNTTKASIMGAFLLVPEMPDNRVYAWECCFAWRRLSALPELHRNHYHVLNSAAKIRIIADYSS